MLFDFYLFITCTLSFKEVCASLFAFRFKPHEPNHVFALFALRNNAIVSQLICMVHYVSRCHLLRVILHILYYLDHIDVLVVIHDPQLKDPIITFLMSPPKAHRSHHIFYAGNAFKVMIIQVLIQILLLLQNCLLFIFFEGLFSVRFNRNHHLSIYLSHQYLLLCLCMFFEKNREISKD